MKIAICDDDLAEISLISSYISEYIQEREHDIDFITFSGARDLLEYDNAKDIVIYLLDIIMPEINGIELGHRIREINKNAFIIYITAAKEFSISAFSVRAFSYLLKPINKDKLFSELDECFKNIKKPISRLLIKTSDGIINVSLKDITAVEYSNHRLVYHLLNNRTIKGLYQKSSFEKQASVLIKSGLFVKISSSYFINMKNVKIVTAADFIMKDLSKYNITRKYADSKKIYIEFIMEN